MFCETGNTPSNKFSNGNATQYRGSERLYNKMQLLNFLSTGASQMVLTLQNPFLSYRHPTEHILVNPLDNIQIPEQSN